MHLRSLASASAAALLALAALPAPAAACGGFFCQRTPMNQAGENILFAVEDDGAMTAYVQILYSGAADRFAWLLPLPSVPALAVGTDALFNGLAGATAPRFDVDTVRHGACRTDPGCGLWAEGDSAGGPPSAGGFADAGTAGPTVVLRQAVGPYDAVVLSGGTAQEVHTWLEDNGYDIQASSIPLLEDYLAAGHVFVAIRLLADRDTTEIQPLVLRYREASPCVPLRLTAIATVPDMPVTAYFLARARAAPTNFSLIEPIFDDPALWLGTRSYTDWLSDAANALGGRAFVTDYAGAPPSLSLSLPSVADLADETSPRAFVQALVARGFLGDPQLLALLERHAPPPAGMDATSYYNCLAQSWCSGPEGTLDAPGLVADLEEALIAPRAEADALLGRFPTLTRLATTISASEMTLDPTFRIDPGLEDVSNVHRATLHVDCGPDYFEWAAPRRIVLPSGREVSVDPGIVYPGDDDAYCEDVRAGSFGAWVPRDVAARTAAERRLRPVGGGGAGCAASGTRGAGGLAIVGLALAALGVRRRRG